MSFVHIEPGGLKSSNITQRDASGVIRDPRNTFLFRVLTSDASSPPARAHRMMADRTDPGRTPQDVMIPSDEIRNCQGLRSCGRTRLACFLYLPLGTAW